MLRRANATEFGLASGVFTKDINKVNLCMSYLHVFACHAAGFHTGFFVGEGKKRSRKVTHANT